MLGELLEGLDGCNWGSFVFWDDGPTAPRPVVFACADGRRRPQPALPSQFLSVLRARAVLSRRFRLCEDVGAVN